MEKALEISDDAKKRRAEANLLYITKLVRIVHFLARHNLAVKELFTPMIEFLAFELEEPIIKQYLKTCPKNASYDSHQTCDSLIGSINDYFQQQTDLRLQRAVDIAIYADESTSAARKEMMGIFISCLDEDQNEFALEYFQLVECAGTDAAALLELISKTVASRGIEINRMRFSCLDGTNTMSGHATGLQRRLRNLAPHAMYINCRCHRLALCFKHLMKQFPWLDSIDGLLLGLWKIFYYSGKKRHILREIQLAYGQKPLYTVKAAVTRWLSHGKACKRCRERYLVYVEALDSVLEEGSDAKISSFRDDLLKPVTVMKISFMEDVLAVTNILCLLLQSDRKDFSAIQRALSFTLQKLDGMANDISSRDLSSLQKSSEIIERLDDYNREHQVSTRKRARLDINESLEYFHTRTVKPFIAALIGEIRTAFSISELPVVEAFLAIDPQTIPQESHESFTEYGTHNIGVLFEFYGNAKEDDFLGHRTVSVPLLFCATKESVLLEYGGYKAYVATQRANSTEKYRIELRSQEARLLAASADKRKPKKILNKYEAEVQATKEKLEKPLSVIDLLGDEVIKQAFPSIYRLLKIYLLLPHSEAVVERGFSKMKLIMTKKRTNLDSNNLDALMRLSYNNEKLTDQDVSCIIDIWKGKKNRRIFNI